ncbi:fibronectin type III domain-containing protein (plasmid) [Natrinema halophilum]|nr:fibronectin type III domain-containing protein [Natrinema halophilum]UHQ96486.1 fibronectin type III domain-containing protein [Natrinema halophilum]
MTIAYSTPPSGLSASTVRYRSVDLTWDSVSGADEYRVYRDGSQVGTTTSTSFTDTGLAPTTGYTWEVTSVTDGVESSPSDPASATTGGSAPTDVSVSVVDDDITVTWTDTNGDEDGYEVHRSQSSPVDTSGTPVTTTSANVESFSDTALLDGERYYYRVVAVRNGERGDDSAELDGLTDLPRPTNLTVDSVSGRTATLSWTDPSDNASGYRILVRTPTERNFSQTGSDVAPVSEGETASATTGDLLDGQKYAVTVETFTSDASNRYAEIDVEAGTTLTVNSGETKDVLSPFAVKGTVSNSGTVENS